MTGNTWHLPVKMAGRKRTSASYSSSVECSQFEKKDRRQITVRTFEKWQGQYNTPHESLTRPGGSSLDAVRPQRVKTFANLSVSGQFVKVLTAKVFIEYVGVIINGPVIVVSCNSQKF